MPDILVRNLDEATASYWKDRARTNGRSLQAEIADYLGAAALLEAADREEKRQKFWEWAADFKSRLGPDSTDSAELRHEGQRG